MGRRCWTRWLLLQILGQILLVFDQAGSSPVDRTIRIGYISKTSTYAGAINVAIEQAQHDGLLRGYNFRYNWQILRFCCLCKTTRNMRPQWEIFGHNGLRGMWSFWQFKWHQYIDKVILSSCLKSFEIQYIGKNSTH